MKKITVRSLAEADPDYAKALELRASLRAKRDALDAEENRIRDALMRSTTSVATVPSAVAELLGDAPDPEADVNGPNARLTAIARERVNLRAALEIAEQRLQAARFGASRVICAEVSPEYTERVKSLAAALVTANSAHMELLALIGEMNGQDIAWNGDMVPMQATTVFGHNAGKLTTWLRSAKSAGYIDMIPKGLDQ